MKFVVFSLIAVCAFALRFPAFNKADFAVPELRDGDSVMFVPAELPCSYTLTSELYQNTTTVYDENNVTTVLGDIIQTEMVYGFMEKTHQVNLLPEETAPVIIVDRLDLNETREGVLCEPRFTLNETQCIKEYIPVEEAIKEVIDSRAILIETAWFMGVNDTTFNGTDCKVYYNETNSSSILFYVDENDRIIGTTFISIFGNITSNMTAVFMYGPEPELSDFVMDTTSVVCDDEAYNAPSADFPCENHYDFSSSEIPTSSKGSGSATSSTHTSSSATPAPPKSSSNPSSAATHVISFIALAMVVLALF